MLEIEKEGYATWTIISHGRILRATLETLKPVKLYISQKAVTTARKERIANTYLKYARSTGQSESLRFQPYSAVSCLAQPSHYQQ